MSRVQLALNVADIDDAVGFYSKLFGAEPAKRHRGYANFAISEPPLKLVLIENPTGRGHGVAGALNHLGVEVETPEEVRAATLRLASEGLDPDVRESTTCCFAVQDKAWVTDPDGAPGRCTRCSQMLRSSLASGATEATSIGRWLHRCERMSWPNDRRRQVVLLAAFVTGPRQ